MDQNNEKADLKKFFIKLIAIIFAVIIVINISYNLILADKLENINKFLTLNNKESIDQIKDKIDVLENYQSKSTIVNPKISNVDVFSIVSDNAYAYINFLQLSNGSIIRSHTMEIKKKLEEQDEDLLELAIVEIRERFKSESKELYVPFKIAVSPGLKVTIPKLGDKKRILDLSERNAKFFRQEKFNQIKIIDER